MTGALAAAAAGNGPLRATASPAAVSGSSASGGSVSTATTTCSVMGGTPPYTYAWARVSGDSTMTANAPASAVTAFGGVVNITTPTRTSVWKCTVTDNVGASVDSNTVSAEIDYTGGP